MATALRRSLGHIVALTPQAQESEDTVAPVVISAALAEEKQKNKGPQSPRSQTGAPGPTLLLGREFPDVAKHRPGVQR